MAKVKDIAGQMFGELRIVSLNRVDPIAYWNAECSCGKTVVVNGATVRRGLVRSCGHLRLAQLATVRPQLDPDAKNRWPEYAIWEAMKQRCLNPRNKRYPDYGGRGITICARWMEFDNFIADIGRRPSADLSIDRIDNEGNYDPTNVQWATAVDQTKNKRRNGRRRKGVGAR